MLSCQRKRLVKRKHNNDVELGILKRIKLDPHLMGVCEAVPVSPHVTQIRLDRPFFDISRVAECSESNFNDFVTDIINGLWSLSETYGISPPWLNYGGYMDSDGKIKFLLHSYSDPSSQNKWSIKVADETWISASLSPTGPLTDPDRWLQFCAHCLYCYLGTVVNQFDIPYRARPQVPILNISPKPKELQLTQLRLKLVPEGYSTGKELLHAIERYNDIIPPLDPEIISSSYRHWFQISSLHRNLLTVFTSALEGRLTLKTLKRAESQEQKGTIFNWFLKKRRHRHSV